MQPENLQETQIQILLIYSKTAPPDDGAFLLKKYYSTKGE